MVVYTALYMSLSYLQRMIRKWDLNLLWLQFYINDRSSTGSCVEDHSTGTLQFYTAKKINFIYPYYFLLTNRLFISLDFQRMRVWLCKSFWTGGESCVKREKTGRKSCTTPSKESQPHLHPLVKNQRCWRRWRIPPATDCLQEYGTPPCDLAVCVCRQLGVKPSNDFNLHNQQVSFPPQSVQGFFTSTHSRAQDRGAI